MLEESCGVLLQMLLLLLLLLSCHGSRRGCVAGADRGALGAAGGGQQGIKQEHPQLVVSGKLPQATLIRQVAELRKNAASGSAAAMAGCCSRRVVIQVI
jgi:hypothetical protein